MLFMYGFYASYNSIAYTTRLEYILTNALAVLGFGLLLVYFKHSIRQTLVIALLVCSINAQLGPLLQQFWYNVFINGFYSTYGIPTNTTFKLISDTATNDVKNFTLGFVRISTYCSISLLVALSGVIGKIGLVNTLLSTFLFNIGFNLNYYLNYAICYKNGSGTTISYIMDDFQGSRVFMFGAGFGLALLILYNKFNPVSRPEKPEYTDTFSSLLTLLGTSFVLALFYFVLDTYTNTNKVHALLNIYFAFSGSIVSSIAISCILGETITFHHINMTIISGVLQISIIGGFIRTPYVAILVGAFSGIVTSLLSCYLQPKINKSKIIDAKGIIVVYLINCILCSYFICPIIIKAYENAYTNLFYNEGYHMIYTTISLGIGFCFGVLAGALRSCIKEDNNLLDNQFFNKVYLP